MAPSAQLDPTQRDQRERRCRGEEVPGKKLRLDQAFSILFLPSHSLKAYFILFPLSRKKLSLSRAKTEENNPPLDFASKHTPWCYLRSYYHI